MNPEKWISKNTPQIARFSTLHCPVYWEEVNAIYIAIKCVHEYNYYYSESIEQAFLGSGLKFERTGKEYSYKEKQIIEFLRENKSEKEIAAKMGISLRGFSINSNTCKNG